MQHYDNSKLSQQGIALVSVLIYGLLAAIIIIAVMESSLHHQKQVENNIDYQQNEQVHEQQLLELEKQMLSSDVEDMIGDNITLLESVACVEWQQELWQVNYYQLKITSNNNLMASIIAKPIKINPHCQQATQLLQRAGRQSWRLIRKDS